MFSRDYNVAETAKEIMMYSPILLITDMNDGRIEFDNLIDPIYSRQYGLVVTFEPNRQGNHGKQRY